MRQEEGKEGGWVGGVLPWSFCFVLPLYTLQ